MESRQRPVARYRPDISLGNILTALAMSVAVLTWGLRLQGRVTANEQIAALQQRNNDLRFAHLENRMTEQRADMDRTLAEIKSGLTRIEEKLDRKADKP